MKLSTANLSQKLQKLKPIEKLSGKLKRVAIAPPKKRSGKTASSANKSGAKTAADNNNPSTKPSTAESASKPEVAAEKQTAAEKSSDLKDSSANKYAAVPGFIQNSKLVKNSKSARVAFHLLLVKPWVLVAGLWLVSAVSGLIALEGMISPSRLTKDLPEPTTAAAPAAKADSFIDVEQDAEGITSDGSDSDTSQTEAVETVASGSSFPVWPLVTLVGSCAAGCVVISRRRAMLQMAATRSRNRGRKLQAAKSQTAPVRLKAVDSKVTRKKGSFTSKQASVVAFQSSARLADKAADKAGSKATREKKRRSRKRPSPQPISNTSSSKKRVLVSRSNAQKAAPQSRVSQPQKPQRTRQKVARLVRRQPVVSVVPANHSNRLDWAEGSLAHDMDRRFSMREESTQRKRAAM